MQLRRITFAFTLLTLSAAVPSVAGAGNQGVPGGCSMVDEGVECERSVDDQCCDRWLCLVDFKKKGSSGI